MKRMKLLLLPGILAIQSLFAQTNKHLTLSEQFPAPGEKITFTYDPSGTVVDGKKDITAAVYYLDEKNYPVDDIALEPNGPLLRGEIKIPENTKAFFIRISSGNEVDNNNNNGYIYLVYKDKQPVQGAYASEAALLTNNRSYYAKIKRDLAKGVELYKKEFELYPKSEEEYQLNYYFLLSQNPKDKAIVDNKIASLEKSADEKDLMLAVELMTVSNDGAQADSLNKIVKARFPDGLTVKNDMKNAFVEENDKTKKDSLYKAYIKKYPETTAEKNKTQDNLRFEQASQYLKQNDFANYYKIEGGIKNRDYLAEILNNIAYNLAKKNVHLDDAGKLSKQSLDIMAESLKKPVGAPFMSPLQMKESYAEGYDRFSDTYAFILMKKKDYAGALQYEQPVIDHEGNNINEKIYEHYICILSELGQSAKARQYAEAAIRKGADNAEIRDLLKKNYIKVKGSDNGYDDYLAALEKELHDKAKAELAKTMINEPANAFTLTDIEGKTVSLADLKGKIVVLDFWATWCGPCKASFPGMQMAVNKYKNDPNVKFLFIDTWESGDHYGDAVKKFIADNKYSFQVLIDDKTASGKQDKVVTAYGVGGIPTKFVIDRAGNIRFKYPGYSGSAEKVLEEVTNMIDMASHPEAFAGQSPGQHKLPLVPGL
ncbi:MAG TPA: redoxin domain-containing protein [Puia sp.]|nr:redoxin domain-containing protein [Puia sp.]